MIETEIKILDIEPDSVRRTLKKNGAKFSKKVFQQNYIYSNDHTKKSKITVRVRKEGKKAILTVKANRRLVRNYKVLDEYETAVDFDIIVKMLEILGLKLFASTEMKREYWNLNDCSIEICILSRIPAFLEIEGSEKDIDAVAKILGYSRKDYKAEGIFKYYDMKTRFLRF